MIVMVRVGELVRLIALPGGVATMPPESRAVFGFCLGRTYCVVERDSQGLYVLDVSADIDARFGGFMNDLRVEAEYLEVVAQGTAAADT